MKHVENYSAPSGTSPLCHGENTGDQDLLKTGRENSIQFCKREVLRNFFLKPISDCIIHLQYQNQMEKDEIPIIKNKRFDIKLVHISDSLRRQFPESCSRGRPPYPP